MDITSAFLNGDLKEEVYIKQPEGFTVKGKEHFVCKLNRSLYGLKQSPRCWNSVLNERLIEMGFKQSSSDQCIYISSEKDFLIGVCVDDMVLVGKSDEQMKIVKKMLAERFEVKDMGPLHHFLGVKVNQNITNGTAWIGQPAYTDNLLKKFSMEKAKPVKTPMTSNSQLRKANEDDKCFDQTLYQSAVGGLLYLSTRTRPDIAFAVSNVARFCSKPTMEHWTAVKRIMRYLRGTADLGLLYSKSDEFIGYSDADWRGDCNDHKSTSGFLFQVGGQQSAGEARNEVV
jgi:acid phosphatase class B